MKGAGNINWSQEKNQNHYVHTPSKQKNNKLLANVHQILFLDAGILVRGSSFFCWFSRINKRQQQLNNSPNSFWTHLLSVFPLLVVVVLFLTISRNSCRPWVENIVERCGWRRGRQQQQQQPNSVKQQKQQQQEALDQQQQQLIFFADGQVIIRPISFSSLGRARLLAWLFQLILLFTL